VRHHGALGSFVRVYARTGAPAPAELARAVRGLDGIDQVLDRTAASAEYDLPYDNEADLVVTGDRNTVFGASESEHDLAGLAGHRLRSHGGRGEQRVPFLVSVPLNAEYRDKARGRLRNFDIYDFALNGTEAA
jgi:phosphonoacetate hydrolase